MKKTKLERRTHKELIFSVEVDWPAFKEGVEEKIRILSGQGYENPKICHDEYQIWIEMTKTENDESYQKRLADSEKSEQIRIAQRIEKLKKEAKELGLEVR